MVHSKTKAYTLILECTCPLLKSPNTTHVIVVVLVVVVRIAIVEIQFVCVIIVGGRLTTRPADASVLPCYKRNRLSAFNTVRKVTQMDLRIGYCSFCFQHTCPFTQKAWLSF